MKRSGSAFAEVYAMSAWLWAGGNLVLAAGLLGWLDRVTLTVLGMFLVAGFAAIVFRARRARAVVAQAARANPVLFAALVLVVLIEAIPALAPPTARDALIHHLAMPHLFLRSGRIVNIPFAVPSYYPQTVDMLFLIPVGLGEDRVASLIHLGLGILASLVLAARARRWAGDRAGILAALLFLTLPVVVTLASAAYVDLGLCLYTFLALESFLRWCEAGQRGNGLVWCALALGFALSVKYSALVIAASLAVFVLLETVRHATIGHVARRAVLCGFLFILPALPWLARNAGLTRDPFYPLFPSLFGVASPFGPSLPGPLALRRILYGESNIEIALLPFRLFLSGREGDPRLFDGRLNPFLPVLAFGLLLAGGRRHPLRGGWAVGCFSAFGTVLTLLVYGARVRYVLPFVGVLCPIAAAALPDRLDRGLVGRRTAGTLLILALGWNGWHFVRALEDPVLVAYLAGREDRRTYLTRKIPAYPLYEAANAAVGAGGRVQLLFMGDQGYYLHVPYTYESYFSGRGLEPALRRGPESVEAYFLDRGVTHLLVNEAILHQFVDGLSDRGAKAVWRAFARSRLTPLVRRGPFALYEIRETTENQGGCARRGAQDPVRIGR